MGGQVGNRSKERLSPRFVATAKEPGYYADGGGLYLQVSKAGTKSWIYRYTIEKRTREMGLGALTVTTLKQAREKADEYRKLVAAKKDPIEQRDAKDRDARAANDNRKTFKECAEAYIGAHAPGWRNAKHADQWRNTLKTYAYPFIGDLAVGDISVSNVCDVLQPIWNEKTETATRVRGRIESVLDYASVKGLRSGDNPARWRGHMDKLFPKRSAVRKVKHHEAVPYGDVPKFLQSLRAATSVSSAALQFVILTAARTGEALGAKWEEINEKDGVWTVPADRMKAKREHRVPLSSQALAALKAVQPVRNASGLIFPSPIRDGEQMSDMALLVLVKRLAGEKFTTHGFRSSFRDWAAEQTGFPSEVVEMALAHTVRNQVEAAYRRGDLFEKRRKLMQAWADYTGTVPKESGKVVPLKKAAA